MAGYYCFTFLFPMHSFWWFMTFISGQKQPVQSPVVPDPGGIYELAKDINAVPRPSLAPRSQSASAVDQGYTQDLYSHLSDATSRLQHTNIADAKPGAECYDHLWSDNTVSASDSETVRVSSPKTSSSSADEVFKPITSNYEEPWDSEEGQNKFSRLMKRAEKTDERRQSVDKYSGAKPPVPTHRTSKVSVDNSVNKYDQNTPSNVASVTSPKVKKEITPSYEDAWDLPEKQREFEEKLEKARKSRTSQGQIAPDNQGHELQPSVSPVSKYFKLKLRLGFGNDSIPVSCVISLSDSKVRDKLLWALSVHLLFIHSFFVCRPYTSSVDISFEALWSIFIIFICSLSSSGEQKIAEMVHRPRWLPCP